jgi:hypothetical protein
LGRSKAKTVEIRLIFHSPRIPLFVATEPREMTKISGCVANTVFESFRVLVKLLQSPSIGHFSKSIKHSVCSRHPICNTSVDQLLDGLEHTAGQLATSIRFPPLDIMAWKQSSWEGADDSVPGRATQDRLAAHPDLSDGGVPPPQSMIMPSFCPPTLLH